MHVLPLPDTSLNREQPHRQVLTGEFHCDDEELDYSAGYFVPHEYMEIIIENIRLAAKLRGLDMKVQKDLAGVKKGSFDIIVFAAVRKAEVTDSAQVSLNTRMVSGETFATLDTLSLNGTESRSVDHPLDQEVHFIGEHGNDFQGQRTILSRAAYDCAQQLMNAIIRRAGS